MTRGEAAKRVGVPPSTVSHLNIGFAEDAGPAPIRHQSSAAASDVQLIVRDSSGTTEAIIAKDNI